MSPTAVREIRERLVNVSGDVWADQWSRPWLLPVVTMTLLLLIGLFATNPHVDWSQ